MNDQPTTDRQRNHEQAQAAACNAISPRASRHFGTPEESRAFAEMDSGEWAGLEGEE